MSKLLIRSIFTIILLMGLSACGGGGGFSGDSDSGDPDPGDPAPDPTPSSITMGTQIGHTFTEGALEITDSTLTAAGSTTVTVYLVDENDDPITTGIDKVTFSSTCVEASTATITSPVTVASGKATATYQIDGCTSTDTITVQAEYDGNTLTASGTVSITGADIIKMGRYSGATFIENTLDLSTTTLSAGGSASVTAYLVDADDSPIADGTVSQVTFTSTCISQGTANITTPVEVSSGNATATYEAVGCVGDDIITARAITSSGVLTASGTITVAGADIGSIAFVSATPEFIALAGTGGAGRSETSTVKFKVLNEAGGAVANTNVSFALNTTIGGLFIDPATAETDSEGFAQTIVNSGSVPTAIRVTATVVDTNISTQSDKLTISSGVPDQDSFSISASILNPEAWNHDGVPITITARLADHFNNPVPDGTAVTFITEGGSIGGSCNTTDGVCSTIWTSQAPRPIDGRVTILAYAVGEETFVDANGSGKFDKGWDDDDNASTPNILEPFTDLPEAWRDDDEDGCRDIANASTCTTGATTTIEEFLDFGGGAGGAPNGIFDTPNSSANGAPEGDGIYNGVLCDDASCSSAPKSLHVRNPIVLIMSGKTPMITLTSAPPMQNGCILLTDDTPLTVQFVITDERLQQMPSTTEVSSATVSGTGITGTQLGGISKWPNTSSASIFPFTIQLVGTLGVDSTGSFSLTIETPGRDQDIDSENDNSITTISQCIILDTP